MHAYRMLWRRRPFRWLAAADAISVFGDQIGWMALLWLVMDSAKRSEEMGLLAFGFGLPSVLLGPVMGNVLDHWSPKKALLLANVLLGCLFTLIPILNGVHQLSFGLLLFLVVLAGCLTPMTTVGWMVLMPQVVAEEDLLGVANSISETLWQTAALAGPIFSGLLVAHMGASWAVLVDGVSFWVSALCLLLIPCREQERQPNPEQPSPPQRSFWAEVMAGFRYLYGNKAVWWITLGALFLNVAYGQLEVSLPLFVHRERMASAVVLGSLWMVYFISSICGAAASGLVRSTMRPGVWMALMVIGWGISFLPMIGLHLLLVSFVTMALAGFLFSGYAPMARTAVQRLVPSAWQGRVFGVRMSIIGLGVPAGSLYGGLAANWMRPSTVIGSTGCLIVVLGIVLLLVRPFRNM